MKATTTTDNTTIVDLPIRSHCLILICLVRLLLGRWSRPTLYSANVESILRIEQHRPVGIHLPSACAIALRENADSRAD
jgi:hypothetical protein